MKKVFFALLSLCLCLVSCGKKAVETETLSGLLPSKFEYTTENNEENKLYVLKNANGLEVTVINIGARIVSLVVPDKNGVNQNVVLGYDNIEPYTKLGDYFGAIVGRYANRIADGKFELDRVTYRVRQNEIPNLLHGGPRGFSTRYFSIEQPNEQSVICSYLSKNGDEGFPGNLTVTVTYTLSENNALTIAYQATTDRATVINLSNHAYFNLSGAESQTIADQALYIDATQYTPTRPDLIPTGEIAKTDAVLDFTTARPITPDFQYDLNYVLNHPGEIANVAAKLYSPTTGISMEIYTTEPGLQFYNDKKRPSFALEPQHFPDSPNHPNFPTTILRKDSVFNSQSIYQFKIEK